ncbi:MAG: carboxypeptidase regulatory-like domain-containing protein [bacterium]|nr:carboxypeptidase regulatory-like domain-containing protein [Candidatus Sumerlaeota bacterium]
MIAHKTAQALAVVVAALSLLVTGCEDFIKKGAPLADTPKTGSLAGSAMLADAKEGGHAGIIVFLGGTSFAARTDENGSYMISSIPPGEYPIMAERAGYQTTTVERVRLDPALHTNEHPLVVQTSILERDASHTTQTKAAETKLGSIRGSVAVMGEHSGEGVRVAIGGTPIVTVTDESGTYRFINVETGRHVLTFNKDGFSPRDTPVQVQPGTEAQAMTVMLERAALPAAQARAPIVATPTSTSTLFREDLKGNRTIYGLVEAFDDDGKKLADYSRVTVALDNSDYAVQPDEKGRYQFVSLPPGIYMVLAMIDTDDPQRQIVDVMTMPSAEQNFTLGGAPKKSNTKPGSVTGKIVLPGPDDAPLPDASGVSVGLAGTQSVAITDKTGVFKFENVAEGKYSLAASMDGYEPLRKENIAVAQGQTLNLGEIPLEPKRDYPRVVAADPQDGARNIMVSNEQVIKIDFSKVMNAETVKKAVSLQPTANWQALMGKGSHPLADDDTLVIVMNNQNERLPVKYNTNYRIVIARSASDTSGLGMKQDYSMGFTTGAPGITSTMPRHGDHNIYVDQFTSPITINCNTKLKGDSVSVDTVRLRPNSGLSYSVTRQDNSSTGWTTIYVYAQLQNDTDYTFTVTRDVRTFNGQPLSNTPYTVRFRTAQPRMIEVTPQVIH